MWAFAGQGEWPMKSSLGAATLSNVEFARQPTMDTVAFLRRLRAEWRAFVAPPPKNTKLLDWFLFVPHG
jgi:hypothetical protein